MAHRPRRLITVALSLLLLAATACGSNNGVGPNAAPNTGTPSSGASASGSATPNASGSAGTSGTSGTPGTPNASGSASASGQPSGSASAKPSGSATAAPAMKVAVRIAKACIKVGEEQVVEVTTEPKAGVAMDTLYADRKDGQTHGGVGSGVTNDAGKHSFTWIIRPGTPNGPAYSLVKAAKDGKKGKAIGQFRVASSC